MIENSTNYITPSLRFSGFKDSWKKIKLGDIASVLQGYGFPEKYQGQKEGELPFCKVGDISSAVDRGDLEITTANNYVNHALLPSLHAQPVPVGSTVFAKIGEAIRSNKKIRTGVPCLIDNNAAAVKSKGEISDIFLFYLVSRINLADYSGGIVPSVNKSTIEAIEVMVPNSQEEQLKIASCLLAIDKLISAQNHKVESLKAHKKGLMQQLFPQPGTTTPSLRFPGFTGKWEKKMFRDITAPAGKKNRQNLPYERYSISNEVGFYPQNNQFEDGGGYLKDIDCRQYIIVPPKSFAYNPARINVGSIGYQDLEKEVIVSSLYEVFKTTDACDDLFLWHWFHSHAFKTMVLNVQEGGVRQYFYYNKLQDCKISLPCLSEQKMIGYFLSSLDNMIVLEAAKAAALNEQKKGLMQQLFPSLSK